MNEGAVERYLRLGLQLGRHVEGVVDAYYGPADLAAAVEAEPPAAPTLLADEADALLAEVDDGWLHDQLVGLRAYAGVLAGEDLSYADEVEACYGVRPTHTDESVFEAAHAELEKLLPGEGTLAERYERAREAQRVPADRVEEFTAAVLDVAREWTLRVVELPAGEGLDLKVVRDVPWMAFCYYLGNYRSQIEVNVDLPMPVIELLTIAAHEAYPGHHTERCAKEKALVRDHGMLEESIVLVPTPQSLIAEGIAKLAPSVLLAGGAGEQLAAIARDAGIEFDLARAVAVDRAIEPCAWAEVNASLMLYEDGATEEEIRAYMERWGLMTPEISAHVVRFMKNPTSRTYIVCYPAGKALCSAWVGEDESRFRRLLTEQVRVPDLVAATA
jgi:hypothetical protein